MSHDSQDSIVASLFYGEINENACFPFPRMSNEQKEMAKSMTDAIEKFATTHIDSTKLDKQAKIPREILSGLAELGLCGLAVPEELGGMGLDYTLYSKVFEKIASYDGSIAVTLGAHQSIGFRALLNEGNEQQKKKWLPALASGEKFAAFCLTEPGSGSDAYSIKTKATKNADGTYTISGQKLWITNAGLADFYSVYCKTDHEDNGKKSEKITCFIVEKERAGISFGEPEDKMGIKASETRAVYFDKVIIPAENILGEEGKGFKIAMNVLNTGRLSLGAGAVGAMKTIIKMSTEHANNRKQFDRPIKEFGLVQDKFAQMASLCYASESMVYMTTGKMVNGMKEFALESAICKVFCSEALWKSIDMGMQIAGGNGYMKEYPYERIMRDSRINLIFEGTNEILRCFIALMGIQGPSVGLKELGKVADISSALADPIKSLGVLSDFAKKRITKMMDMKTLSKVHERLHEESEHFCSMMNSFSIQIENTIMKYKKTIVDHELPQKRIANMAIELYMTLAVLSRTTTLLEDNSISQEKKETLFQLAKLSCRDARHRFMENSKDMEKNIDQTIQKISDDLCLNGAYIFDSVDF